MGSSLSRITKATSTQKVNVKATTRRTKSGKTTTVKQHTATRKKAKPKAQSKPKPAVAEPLVKIRNTAGLTQQQMTAINDLVAAGALEVSKSGSKYRVRTKLPGKTRWSQVGEFGSQAEALTAIAKRVPLSGPSAAPAPDRPEEWKRGAYGLKIVGNRVHVVSPYDPKIISAAKGRGGRWDAERRVWVLPLEKYDSMRAMIEKHVPSKDVEQEASKHEVHERAEARQREAEARRQANLDTPAEEWSQGPFRIDVLGTKIMLRSPKDYDMIAEIKRIPGAEWLNSTWTVERVHYQRLREIAERYSRPYIVPDGVRSWKSGKYQITVYNSRVGLTSPYNTDLIARVKRIPGAEWFPRQKQWMVPGAQYDALRSLAEEFAAKDAAVAGTEHEREEKATKRVAEEVGTLRFSHMGPETARKSDFAQIGDIIKHGEQWVVITSAKYQLGHDEDFSFAHFTARPTTAEEARPYLEAEERRRYKELTEARRTKLAARITAEGDRPDGPLVVEGERYSDRQNIHGGGDWFVVGPEHVWYVQNNGMDGDDWSRNNVRTGGAGAIGWRVPRTDEFVNEIKAICEVLVKSLTSAGKRLRNMADREPINTDSEPLSKSTFLFRKAATQRVSVRGSTHRTKTGKVVTQPGYEASRITKASSTVAVKGSTQRTRTGVRVQPAYQAKRSKATAKVTTPKGNVQYVYDEETLAAAKAEKFRRVAHLAEQLPEIIGAVQEQMTQPDTPLGKVVAAVVALIDRCQFRIGTDEYAEKHGTYGVTTLRPEHVTVDGDTVQFRFTGKKQVPWDKATTDSGLAEFISHLAEEGPGDRLFWYHAPSGEQRPIRASHVNAWLREYGVSAKDFRTYHATRLCYEELKRASSRKPLTKKEIKARVKAAVEATAERLGHTPAVCRQSYILPAVIEDFEANGGKLSINPWKAAKRMGKSFLFTRWA